MNKLIVSFKDFKKMPYNDTKTKWTTTKGEFEGILYGLRERGILKKHAWVTEGATDEEIESLVLEMAIPVRSQTRTIQLRFQPTMIYTESWKGSRSRGDKKLVKKLQRNASWRMFYWGFKAKMEAVLYGLVTLQNEFMSHIVLSLKDDSVTFGDALEVILEEGRLGNLLEDLRDV